MQKDRLKAMVRVMTEDAYQNSKGLEKMMVGDAIRVFFPLIERKIEAATEEELSNMLTNIRTILDHMDDVNESTDR